MYEDDRIGDLTFGLNSQALAVLQILAQTEPHFAEYDKENNHYKVSFNTYPWYNGRERGIVISMYPDSLGGSAKHLYIAVFEHRNSDQICCLRWETNLQYLNAPTADKETLKKAYHGGNKWDVAITFGCLEVGKCVEWIEKELETFYTANHEEGVESK